MEAYKVLTDELTLFPKESIIYKVEYCMSDSISYNNETFYIKKDDPSSQIPLSLIKLMSHWFEKVEERVELSNMTVYSKTSPDGGHETTIRFESSKEIFCEDVEPVLEKAVNGELVEKDKIDKWMTNWAKVDLKCSCFAQCQPELYRILNNKPMTDSNDLEEITPSTTLGELKTVTGGHTLRKNTTDTAKIDDKEYILGLSNEGTYLKDCVLYEKDCAIRKVDHTPFTNYQMINMSKVINGDIFTKDQVIELFELFLRGNQRNIQEQLVDKLNGRSALFQLFKEHINSK